MHLEAAPKIIPTPVLSLIPFSPLLIQLRKVYKMFQLLLKRLVCPRSLVNYFQIPLYLAHLLRTKHQASYYQFVLSNVKPSELVVIIDYKMKLELEKYSQETQRQFYGKRGLSLHGFYVVAKTTEGIRESGVVDLWCEDTKQDSWFSQSALDIGFKCLQDKYPSFSVYLFSDTFP